MRVTISAGVAVAQGGEAFDQLYATADHALYSAKAAGRNTVNIATETIVNLSELGDETIVPVSNDGCRKVASQRLLAEDDFLNIIRDSHSKAAPVI